MSGVEIRIRADSRAARSDLALLNKSVQNIDKTAKNVSNSFKNMAIQIGAAFSAVAITRGITKAADSITNLENRIALVTGRGKELNATLNKLYVVSANSRSRIAGSAEIYNRFGLALRGTALDSKNLSNELVGVTSTIQKAIAISGADAASANAAIIQLGQGLASGELRGQELNSVREQIPRVAKAIADGLGVELGALKGLAEDGVLTTAVVYKAIQKAGLEIDQEFLNIRSTVSAAANALNNEFIGSLSKIDRAIGFSDFFIKQINTITDGLNYFRLNFDTILKSLEISLLVFKVKTSILFSDMKWALIDFFELDGVDLDFIAKLGRVRDSIKNIFFETKTVSTPGGEKITERLRGFKEISELVQASFNSITLPEISLESFTNKLTAATEAIKYFYEKGLGLFKDSAYNEVEVPGGIELVTKNNTLGKFVKFFDTVSTKFKDFSQDVSTAFSGLSSIITFIDEWATKIGQRVYDLGVYLIWNSIIKDIVNDINSFVSENLSAEAWTSYAETIKGVFKDIKSFLTNGITQETVMTPGGPKLVRTDFGQQYDDYIQQIKNKFLDLEQFIQDVSNRIFLKTIDTPAGPKVADTRIGAAVSSIEGTKAKIQLEILPALREDLTSAVDATLEALNSAFQSVLGFGTVGGLGLLIFGGKGLLIRIAGFTFLSSDLGASEIVRESAKEVANSFITTLRETLEGGEGSVITGAMNIVEGAGSGVLQGLGLPEDNELANTIAGAFAVALGLAAISSKFRAAIVLFAQAFTTDFGSILSNSKNQSRIKLGITRAFGAAIGLYLAASAAEASDNAMDDLGVEEDSWFRLGGNFAAQLAAGFAGWKLSGAFFNAIDNAILEVRTNPNGKMRGLGRVLGSWLAYGISGSPVVASLIAAAIGAAVIGGYAMVANSYMKEGQDIQLALGLVVDTQIKNINVGDGFDQNVTKNLAKQLSTALSDMQRDAITELSKEQGISGGDLFKAAFEEGILGEDFEKDFNKRLSALSNRQKSELDLSALFPTLVFDQKAIDDLINNDNFNIGGILSSAITVDQSALSSITDMNSAMQDSTAAFDALDQATSAEVLSEATDRLSTSLTTLAGVELVTSEQVKSVDELSTSINGLTTSLSSYGDKISEIKGLNIPLAQPGSSATTRAFASGGSVSGPGTGTSDSIPAYLSNGEYVIKAASVKKFGSSFLDSVNQGKTPRFATGGLVGGNGEDSKFSPLGSLYGAFGLNAPLRKGGFLSALMLASPASTRIALDGLMTGLFNSNSFDGRLSNFVTGNADTSVYETMTESLNSALMSSILGMGIGSIAGTPGVGTVLGLMGSVSNSIIESLQGFSVGFRALGYYDNAPGFVDKALMGLEGGYTFADVKRQLLSGPKAALEGLSGWGGSKLSSFTGWLGERLGFSEGGLAGIEQQISPKYSKYDYPFGSSEYEFSALNGMFFPDDELLEGMLNSISLQKPEKPYGSAQLLLPKPESNKYTPEDAYNVSVHEFGHANMFGDLLEKNNGAYWKTITDWMDLSQIRKETYANQFTEANSTSVEKDLSKHMGYSQLSYVLDEINKNTGLYSNDLSGEARDSLDLLPYNTYEEFVSAVEALNSRQLADAELGDGLLFKSLDVGSKLGFSVSERLGRTKGIKEYYGQEEPESAFSSWRRSAKDLISGFASGGHISGPGSGTSDSILAYLSNGEYVIKADSVKKYGEGFLNSINSGSMPKFANGGSVGIPRFKFGGLANDPNYIRTKTSLDSVTELLNETAIKLSDERIVGAERNRFITFKNELLLQQNLLKQSLQDISEAFADGAETIDSITDETITPGPSVDPTDKEPTEGFDFATRFKDSFETGLSQALRDGDFKAFGKTLLDSFTGSVIDSFSKGFTDALFGSILGTAEKEGSLAGFFNNIMGLGKKTKESLTLKPDTDSNGVAGDSEGIASMFSNGFESFGQGFENLFGELGTMLSGAFQGILGLFSGDGGGGFFSSILGLFSGAAMSSGGIVPHTPYSKIGVDSVPTMLTPGELVVPENKVNGFMGGVGNTTQTVVNLSVTGDISRQTRKEIIKMMPSIAQGVNSQNKESNYRR